MARTPQDITDAELDVLQVLWKHGPLTIRRITELLYGDCKTSHYATVQKLLDRLESKGFLKSWVGDPTPQRGGRRRKFYALRPAGVAAMRQAYRAFTARADGLQSRLELK